jgi:carbon-monoxide dehydrogenase small subunit
MTRTVVSFMLGDREIDVLVEPMTTLLSVLRDELGHTAAKEGCRQGGCGACTVLIDGEPFVSCLLPTEDVAGRRVETVETRNPVGGVGPLQQAFLDHNGFQCGYCTPGFVMIGTALLDRTPHPDEDEIIEAIGGNVCRCTGYRPILDAIAAAAAAMPEAGG